eukprot:3583160-Amphidinium_carterae.1
MTLRLLARIIPHLAAQLKTVDLKLWVVICWTFSPGSPMSTSHWRSHFDPPAVESFRFDQLEPSG